jgi:hypothetical protein
MNESQPSDASPADVNYPSFPVQPYRSDNGFSAPGLIMLITAMTLAGAVLGYVAHFIGQWFYLILLFPIGIGFVLGLVGQAMVKQGRIRNALIGGLAGIFGGVAAMTMMHYFDYQKFQKDIASAEIDEGYRELAKLPPGESKAAVRELFDLGDQADVLRLIDLLRVDSFMSYMDAEAKQGVQIKRATRGSDAGLNLGYWGSWIYWIIEALVVAGITFVTVKSSTAEPFCSGCGVWKQPVVLGSFSGDPAQATAALESGDLNQLAAAGATAGAGPLTVSMAQCVGCTSHGSLDLKLEALAVNSKGQTERKQLAHTSYPPESLQHLQQVFAAPPLATSAEAAPQA